MLETSTPLEGDQQEPEYSPSGRPLGDQAEYLAKKFVTETCVPVAEAAAITEEAALASENNIFTKIRFSWRPEDRAALERVRASADGMFAEAFEGTIQIIDQFYEMLRVPATREGIVVRDTTGRTVWQRDDQNRIIERWSQLTGQDIEFTLLNLERVKLTLAPKVNSLMLEALYARQIAGDISDEAWLGIMEGTQGDKTAKANRESRMDRYHAYFRFYLYSVADAFLKEVNAFMKLLNDIRWWQIKSQR
jgi:hypothetical protein